LAAGRYGRSVVVPGVGSRMRSRRSARNRGFDTLPALRLMGIRTLLPRWKVSLGDERITPAEFERLLGKATGIVRFRGQYVYLDSAEIEQLRARLARAAPVSGSELLRVALAGEVDGAPVGLNKAAEKLLQQLTSSADVAAPKGLRATLRLYQRRGYAWLWRNARLGLGSVIADDMGLGKTLQVLALLPRLKEVAVLAE